MGMFFSFFFQIHLMLNQEKNFLIPTDQSIPHGNEFNLNTIFPIISCFAFLILKNVSRQAQSNEESEEDSVSTPDDATESSDESSPEDKVAATTANKSTI